MGMLTNQPPQKTLKSRFTLDTWGHIHALRESDLKIRSLLFVKLIKSWKYLLPLTDSVTSYYEVSYIYCLSRQSVLTLHSEDAFDITAKVCISSSPFKIE